MIPRIVQKPVIITLAKALRLNRYTSENDTNTKNELYMNASVCASTNLHAEIKLLREINKQAAAHGRTIKVLLELHIAEEETKYGLSLDACRELLEGGEWRELHNVQICGLMMMASHVDDESLIRKEFMLAADFFDEVKARYFADDDAFCERSWGMSHDYHIAAECGSTMVRVGTYIFGERAY